MQIAFGFGEVQFGRDELLVLRQDDQRLPAKGLRLVAHLGQAAPLVDREFDQAAEFLLQGSDRGGYRRQVVGADIQRYEVLAHEYFLLDKKEKINGAPAVSHALSSRARQQAVAAALRRGPAGVLALCGAAKRLRRASATSRAPGRPASDELTGNAGRRADGDQPARVVLRFVESSRARAARTPMAPRRKSHRRAGSAPSPDESRRSLLVRRLRRMTKPSGIFWLPRLLIDRAGRPLDTRSNACPVDRRVVVGSPGGIFRPGGDIRATKTWRTRMAGYFFGIGRSVFLPVRRLAGHQGRS
jgi:hypothetical protein